MAMSSRDSVIRRAHSSRSCVRFCRKWATSSVKRAWVPVSFMLSIGGGASGSVAGRCCCLFFITAFSSLLVNFCVRQTGGVDYIQFLRQLGDQRRDLLRFG